MLVDPGSTLSMVTRLGAACLDHGINTRSAVMSGSFGESTLYNAANAAIAKKTYPTRIKIVRSTARSTETRANRWAACCSMA